MDLQNIKNLSYEIFNVLISSPAWSGHIYAVEYPDFRNCLEKAQAVSQYSDQIKSFLNDHPISSVEKYDIRKLEMLDREAFSLMEDIFHELENKINENEPEIELE